MQALVNYILPPLREIGTDYHLQAPFVLTYDLGVRDLIQTLKQVLSHCVLVLLINGESCCSSSWFGWRPVPLNQLAELNGCRDAEVEAMALCKGPVRGELKEGGTDTWIANSLES